MDGLLPFKAGAVAHHRHRGCSIVALVAGEDRRLTAAKRGHQTGGVDAGDIGVAAFHKSLVGDVASFSIRIVRNDPHLLARPDALKDGVLRRQLDFDHTRRGRVELRAAGYPLTQDLVILGVHFDAASPFMRHLGNRFQ